ncbi:UNVERIFIED_CONTAM: hypothetical protein Slati_2466600 [Sesamum latifolium]|uniref:Uncharacterized protein n=1 Tax=Sesamum latifolium TaxID=2727402 RepID=A0AAW2WF15_9LAMI
MDLSVSDRLCRVIDEGQWHCPLITDIQCLTILHSLPLIHGGTDRIIWKLDGGTFSIGSYTIFCTAGPKVDWSSLLVGRFKIPHHNFILFGFSWEAVHYGQTVDCSRELERVCYVVGVLNLIPTYSSDVLIHGSVCGRSGGGPSFLGQTESGAWISLGQQLSGVVNMWCIWPIGPSWLHVCIEFGRIATTGFSSKHIAPL